MTEEERIIVSAYTGYLMCDFAKVHKYIEEKMGRPVWTHEMGFSKIQKQIHEATKEDFLKLCENGPILALGTESEANKCGLSSAT